MEGNAGVKGHFMQSADKQLFERLRENYHVSDAVEQSCCLNTPYFHSGMPRSGDIGEQII